MRAMFQMSFNETALWVTKRRPIVCLNSWQFKTENIRGLGKIKTEIKWQKITWWIYFIHFCKVFTSCSLTICKLEWRASYGLKLQQILPGAGDFASEFKIRANESRRNFWTLARSRFHTESCLVPRRFLGFSTLVVAQGSWESFKNAKAQW